MTKDAEIKLLQSLKNDTYFAQAFTPDEIDLMCQNIKSDMYLLLHVARYTKTDVDAIKNKMQAEIDNLRESASFFDEVRRQDLHTMRQVAIDCIEGGSCNNTAYKLIGIEETIKLKIERDIDLTTEEKEVIYKSLRKS